MTGAAEWREVVRERVADCRIFAVERSIAISPFDGAQRAFYVIQSQDWAQIVPVTATGEVVMVRQFRHGPRRITIEIPGGLVDPGEDPEQAALRECLEETGYRARSAAPLGVTNPNPAIFTNRLYAFVATNVEPERAIANSSSEQTEVLLVPIRELPRMLESGEIDHALVAGTLWRYLHERARL